MELDRIPLWRGDHVSIRQLTEDFAAYLYLPRLRDEDVLLAAIQDGLGRLTWRPETFAYADAWDEQQQHYRGLQAGQSVRVLVDGKSLLVKPDVAAKQMEVEKREPAVSDPIPAGEGGKPALTETTTGSVPESPGGVTPQALVLRRFHGSVNLDAVRIGRDAGRIAEEIVQHISSITGAKVEVTLEISANVPNGVPENVVRTVTENCSTLHFISYGFEEE